MSIFCILHLLHKCIEKMPIVKKTSKIRMKKNRIENHQSTITHHLEYVNEFSKITADEGISPSDAKDIHNHPPPFPL